MLRESGSIEITRLDRQSNCRFAPLKTEKPMKPRTNANVLTAEIAIQPTAEGADHRHSIHKSDYPKRALGQKMPMIKSTERRADLAIERLVAGRSSPDSVLKRRDTLLEYSHRRVHYA